MSEFSTEKKIGIGLFIIFLLLTIFFGIMVGVTKDKNPKRKTYILLSAIFGGLTLALLLAPFYDALKFYK